MFITNATKRERDLSLTVQEAAADHETFIVRLFAELFELGGHKVEHYFSDFGRDVFWLERNFDAILNGQVFYFGTRSSGTSIGFDEADVKQMNSLSNTFRVEVTRHDKSWGVLLVVTSYRLG
jgi:hypothetical protein